MTDMVLGSAIVTPTKSEQTVRKPYPNYKVIVLDDDFNTFDHVASCLMRHIPKMTEELAWNLTNQVHFQGQAMVWAGPLEQAELYHQQLRREGLTMGTIGGIMSKSSEGRIVWNHSTHLDGLIPILEKLVVYDGIRTITPAVLSRSGSHIPHLKLKVSVPIRGGFKLIARQGKSVQEVFIITDLTQDELEGAIANILS